MSTKHLIILFLACCLLLSSGTEARRSLKGGKNNKKPIYSNQPRVRKEWRSLDDETRLAVAKAFWTVKTTSSKKGKKLYGPNFENHDRMLMLHSCAVMSPKCDVGHFASSFMTFHRSLLLKYERALLAVNSSIGAMPYWHMAYDAPGGKYYQDELNYIFSDRFFGDLWTKEEDGYAVTNGLFANFPITEYSEKEFGSKSDLAKDNLCIKEEWFKPTNCDQNNTNSKVLLRNHQDCTPYVARYPKDPDGPNSNGDGIGGSYELVYSEDDFNTCINSKYIKNWMDWQNCIEIGTAVCTVNVQKNLKSNGLNMTEIEIAAENKGNFAQNVASEMANELETLKENDGVCDTQSYMGSFMKNGKLKLVNFFHSQAHIKMGKDLLDVTTSPNDAAGFTSYHADIDRSNMHWQLEMAKEIEDQYWGYPKDEQDIDARGQSPITTSGPYSLYDIGMCASNSEQFYEYQPMEYAWVPTTTLDGIVNYGYPFTNLFDCEEDEVDSQGVTIRCDGGDGYTQREILYWTAPERTPYTYDTLSSYYY